MKKLFLVAVAVISSLAMTCNAQLGMFNHLGVSAGIGTNGVEVQLATPITHFFQLRGGVAVMPGINFKTEVDGTLTGSVGGYTGSEDFTLDAKGDLSRTQGNVLLNFYPIPISSFFICGGAYFGGQDLLKVTGHSDKVAQLASSGYVEIGDYQLPINKNGDLEGAFRVSNFRPYLGFGFGRPVPGKLLNVMFEMGVQFHGKIKVMAMENGAMNEQKVDDLLDSDDTFQKVLDYTKVYPVIKLTISGKIF